LINLAFNGQIGKSCPIKCKSFLPERVNTVLQWAHALNRAPDMAESWDFEGHKLNNNYDTSIHQVYSGRIRVRKTLSTKKRWTKGTH
jgi:hypothetical protein